MDAEGHTAAPVQPLTPAARGPPAVAGHLDDDQPVSRSEETLSTPEHVGAPSTHQLRLLLAVAEHLHFGRAAASMGLTQSALSMQVAAAEETLGVRVLERTSRSVRLSEDGHALVPVIAAAVAAIDHVIATAGSLRENRDRKLIVGVADLEAAQPHTAAFFHHLRTARPDMRVQTRELAFGEQFQALAAGKVDVALLQGPLPDGIEAAPLATVARMVCLPATDPLARRRRPVTLRDLARYPVLDAPAGMPAPWLSWWAADPRPGKAPVVYGPVVRDVPQLLRAVANGRGIAMPPALADDDHQHPEVVFRDVAGLPASESVLAWRADRASTAAIAAARDAATAAAASVLPA
ncbi:DNA-binding transcriptional LysR family regulator [Catenuloplanes nepalensis]|uniref:DNA-binding transcriptional LysR family regulator n=1 Tax=Catenuloplanes nepalensis TaxID=587533 RepID=A0ABT9MMC4_9ACTN|nr:LysR family transcriptional regulator [Catenuloplanes nepalensis]MDP9792550.1 DNA-binding transcriptional LysR family regulator [Catenuloplanes nepalensis]